MTAILKPIAFLLIIVAAYLVKRAGLFKPRDYRVMQVVVFDFTLPASIIVSFATNPHHLSMLLISVFAIVFGLLPLLLVYAATRHKPVADRAFLMLNCSGFNIGNFCFPVIQTFMGPSALVTASMFDIGNSVIVTAGSNVMTTSLLHIDMDRPLTEQHAGAAPTLPYSKPRDKDARRLARRAKAKQILKGFLTSVPFNVYLLMIVVMLFSIHIPGVRADAAAAGGGCELVLLGVHGGHADGFAAHRQGCRQRAAGARLALAARRAVRGRLLVPSAVRCVRAKDGGDAVARAHGRVLDTVHRPRTR